MVEKLVNIEEKLAIKILYESAQEVLGDQRVQDVRNWHSPAHTDQVSFDEYDQFMRALEEKFGLSGGHGLALRIGRAAFPYGLKYLGDQVGFKSRDYRLLPAVRRIDTGLRVLADVLSGTFGDQVALSDEGPYWQWRILNGCNADKVASCFLKIGLLQEFTSWAGGGHVYPVKMTECCAYGDSACIYRVDKKPLD